MKMTSVNNSDITGVRCYKARGSAQICRAALLVLTVIAFESGAMAANDDEKNLSATEVLKVLEGPVVSRRFEVLRRLSTMHEPEVVKAAMPSLVKLLKGPDAEDRSVVFYIMGLYPVEARQALPALLKTITDTKERCDVRFLAMGVVQKIRADAKEVVPTLIEMLSLRHRDPRITITALGVNKLGPDDLRIAAAGDLADYGLEAKAAVPLLTEIVKSREESTEMRGAAMLALAEMGSAAREAVPALSETLLQGDSPGLRYDAAETLKRIGPEARSAVPALIAAMKDKNRDVRYTAIWALAAIGPDAKAAIEPLQNTLTDKDRSFSSAAREALKKIAPNTNTRKP